MNILALSAHPDDETLGCAGTLLRHGAAGDTLFWLIVTQAHTPQWSAEVIERKAREVERVAEAYGMKDVFRLGLPTTTLDTVPQGDLIARISEVVAQVKPEVILTVHDGDIHTDHHAVFTAAMSAVKPFRMGQLGVRRILSHEIPSSTDAAPPQRHRLFAPNVFTDITPFIDRKIEIMAMYESEAQSDLLPRGPSALRALARVRGATIGVEYAEAFMLIRERM